jgi:hypothetical protein
MKLEVSRPNIETSGQMEEQFFSIQDQGMMFDILRNKMYSDPILAICREISCNARDAHREIGNQDTPVHITLPNALEPFYKIKDFGPGISPDRMSNVFIKYTASTKRNDNLQTGGFGLGAKTPFSYSDTFTIVTTHNKIKYNYACFIDETKVGKLILMGTEDTVEPNGTEIIIPVKSADFNKFIISTEESTRHWDIKPKITGGTINWRKYSATLKGNGWFVGVVEQDNSYNNNYFRNSYGSNNYDRGIKILIDGIEYHVSMEAVKKFADTSIIDACRGYLFLNFNIGDLSLAANRESIHIDKPTEAKIALKLKGVIKEINVIVKDKIEQYPTYWQANYFFKTDLQSMFNDISFLGQLKWRDIILHGTHRHLPTTVFKFYRDKIRKGVDAGKEKIKRQHSNNIIFEENSLLFFNDLTLTDITPKHIKSALENNNIESVQVVMPPAKLSYSDLDNSYSLTGIGCKQLSTITTGATKKYTAPTSKLILYKLESAYSNFSQVPYSSIEEDDNTMKVLCFFQKKEVYSGRSDKEIILGSGKTIYQDVVNGLYDSFKDNVSFYGVYKDLPEDRIKEEFEGFITLDSFIEDNIAKSTIDFVGLKACKDIYLSSYHEDHQNNLISLIKDPQSTFAKRIRAINSIIEMQKRKKLSYIYEATVGKISDTDVKDWIKKHPEYDLNTLISDCAIKYPLLSNHHMSHGYNPKDVALYINFIDSI